MLNSCTVDGSAWRAVYLSAYPAFTVVHGRLRSRSAHRSTSRHAAHSHTFCSPGKLNPERTCYHLVPCAEGIPRGISSAKSKQN